MFGERKFHGAAVGEVGEEPGGFSFGRDVQGEFEAAGFSVFGRAAIGSHDDRSIDAKGCMHDFFLPPRNKHAGRRGFGAVLVAHEDIEGGAEGRFVEGNGFIAASAEEDVGIDGGGRNAHGVKLG